MQFSRSAHVDVDMFSMLQRPFASQLGIRLR
jgi:hypothetical protein